MKTRKTMDDQFLQDFRRDPRPEFAEALRQKLSQKPWPEPQSRQHATHRRAFLLAGVAAAVTLAALLGFPSVRARAQQFLDLFRVQRFVAVSFDPARLERIAQLKDGKLDLKAMLSQSVEVLKEAGPPQVADSPAIASQMAGIEVRLPAWLPDGVVQEQIRVGGDAVLRFVANTTLLQDVLDALEITDVLVPQELNGATVTVHLPTVVLTHFSRGMAKATLTQAASPAISLPPGVHLPELVEIYLRIAGTPMDEARRFAYSIDWRSTLLVPVPANVASFREVDLGGTKGLLIESNRGRRRRPASRPQSEEGSMLLWSEGDKVYCLSGTIRSLELLQMANAIH
jgi:hypothetical protein